jgi:hypothetical protein
MSKKPWYCGSCRSMVMMWSGVGVVVLCSWEAQFALKAHSAELLLKILVAGQIVAAWAGSAGSRIESVLSTIVRCLRGHACERSSHLVVWQVALTRVWEEWKHSGDSLRAGRLAGADCNEQLHEAVIQRSAISCSILRPRAGRLHDKDVFSTDALSNLHLCFAHAEF